MKEVTASMDRGEMPTDQALINRLLDFSEHTSDKAFKEMKDKINGQVG